MRKAIYPRWLVGWLVGWCPLHSLPPSSSSYLPSTHCRPPPLPTYPPLTATALLLFLPTLHLLPPPSSSLYLPSTYCHRPPPPPPSTYPPLTAPLLLLLFLPTLHLLPPPSSSLYLPYIQ
ncbi:hypothetical protein Pmani_035569 [Petrolisthes manimaculis]|uniref:Uncharacterized protein n=1 Tax=Petrolisthes manimaculis TaxID=1843537 RepID=A0AAE1NM50_9EUCA|nr:hypothetical protein Pmani_035569 [Petrolisthes manimaculis]